MKGMSVGMSFNTQNNNSGNHKLNQFDEEMTDENVNPFMQNYHNQQPSATTIGLQSAFL